MQLAQKHITLFEQGDFFTNDHVEKLRDSSGERMEVALLPVPSVMMIPKQQLEEILKAVPALADSIALRAEKSFYRQTFPGN